jgi:RHS repeat-associated protein
VKSTFNSTTTTYFVGNHYEVTDGIVTKYYYAGSQRIAMRKNGTLSYILGDHLGSTSLVTDAAGTVISQQYYKPWGETRYASGTEQTRYQYTGQYSYTADFGLMFYNARWYDPSLGRFAQADTIVPGGVQGLDRYAYVNNSPIKYTDPSGHSVDCGIGEYGCNAGAYTPPGVGLSDIAQQLIDFSESVEMTPEEVIGIGLGHEMFGESDDEQAIHMQAFRNGYLRYISANCNGNATYNCMLNYYAGSYESVYNQFLSKESGYTERTEFWGNRERYLFVQHIDSSGRSNLSENNQDIVDAGKGFMENFMGTISLYSYDPQLPLNSGVVDALTLNKD